PLATCDSEAGQSRCLAFAPDGRSLAVGSFDHVFAVDVWDPMTSARRDRLIDRGSESGRWRSPPSAQSNGEAPLCVAALAFSPDGATLAAGCSDGVIRLWVLPSGELRQTFSGHVAAVSRLAFAPDGRTLASLGEANLLNLWHLTTGQRLFSLDTRGQELHGLAFSRDGQLLVAGARSAKSDGPSSLLLWRAESAGP